jgi:ATP-dependent Clp protease ATP-binding subunit ClpC
MRVTTLETRAGEGLLAFSGLGSGAILLPESGLHILERGEERPDGGHITDRISATVTVAPWEPGPETKSDELSLKAKSALGSVATPGTVVRRYRVGTAPLVRDAVRGYRTGRLDRVLAGDFDLF